MKAAATAAWISFTDLPQRKGDHRQDPRFDMRDEKIIRQRLEQLRGQLLQWGTPDLQVFVITKDELRGWIRALEWALQTPMSNSSSRGRRGLPERSDPSPTPATSEDRPGSGPGSPGSGSKNSRR